MNIPYLNSINKIKRRYATGEEPVLVECNNLHSYICKYMRTSASAYKLVCELTGAILAKICGIHTPDIAFVSIKNLDWPHYSSINFSAPSFGSKIISEAIDITPVSYDNISYNPKIQQQLLNIAIFDLWTGNEDRNYNNSNLLYDLVSQDIIAIDHGCIFNTATFEYDLSLLTFNETILQSDLAFHLLNNISKERLNMLIQNTKYRFNKGIERGQQSINEILDLIPVQWNIAPEIVRNKLIQLFNPDWTSKCWNNFLEIIEESNYVQD